MSCQSSTIANPERSCCPFYCFTLCDTLALAPGAIYAGMPTQFTYPAAFGDLLTAVLAMVAIPAVATRARSAKPLVWLFNIVGSVDLIDAITLATAYDAAPFMGPAYWIPAFWVPALLVTHYLTFLVLLRGRWPA